MSWLHSPPSLSCGNETAFDEAKPMLEIAQLGCVHGEGSGACTETRDSLQLDGKGETIPEGRECLQLLRFFSSSWGGQNPLAPQDKCTLKSELMDCTRRQGGFGWWGALVCRVSTFLQRPLAWTLKNNTRPLKITPCHAPKEEGG